jgi:hypothetical protein
MLKKIVFGKVSVIIKWRETNIVICNLLQFQLI